MNVQVSKTVLSVGRDLSVFKFVDVGTKLVEAEAGMTENEANTMAVKMAIEEAVVQLIKQGIAKGYFKFDPKIVSEPMIDYDLSVTKEEGR